MIHCETEEISNKLRKELSITPHVRRVKINPYFYKKLSLIVDEVYSNTFYGLNIIEDPSIETYKIEY